MLDLKTYNDLFGKYHPIFIRFAQTYVNDIYISEDIVMDSFIRAWEKRQELTPENFAPYALTMVKNKCLNHLRAQSVRTRVADNMRTYQSKALETRIATLQACDPQELFHADMKRIVDDAIAALPERTRLIFVRSRYHGETYKEIADSLGLSVKSVELEISRAIKELRVSLKDYLVLLAFLLY